MPKAKIVNSQTAAEMVPDLPPAGHQRDEELARRTDVLAEAAEVAGAKTNTTRIDTEAFDEEAEILRFLANDPYTNQQNYHIENINLDKYAYKLVQSSFPRDTPAKEVYAAKAQGWELVSPSTNHGFGPVGANLPVNLQFSARYIGDTVLMYMPRYRYEALRKAQEIRQMQMAKVQSTASIHDDPRGAIAHTQVDDPMVQRIIGGRGAERMASVPTLAQEMARQIASDALQEQIKAGQVPGMQVRR